ncbi:MAG: adenylyltransferase/cytidyltransferase family protein [Flavobacteriales bacterium]|nr:adenylyltransferase/cytidyltransferase family protein [Flavobacteriales bacterium]
MNSPRVMTLEQAHQACTSWQTAGESVVFTNGVFDLLHRGHVTYLEAARAMGSRLIVGLNSDSSVRTLDKAPNRPIVPEQDRAAVLGGLRSVDAVVIFTASTPLELIAELRPDVLVKGGDYDPDCDDSTDPRYIVGRAEVLANGGSVRIVELVPGHSTTAIAARFKSKN